MSQDGLREANPGSLAKQRALVEQLGGSYHQVVGDDVPRTLVDFARAIFVYSVISDAAREATRYAIVHGVLAAGDNPPVTGPGTADPDGSTYVTPQAKAFAFGLDQSLLRVGVCWGYRCTIPPDCSTGTNTAAGPIPPSIRTAALRAGKW